MDPQADLSFLAPPGAVADWRMALLFDTAAGAGVLDALPSRPAEIAGSLGLDAHAVRVLLDSLGAFGMVEPDGAGGYRAGPGLPDDQAGPVLRHHARALRQWSHRLDARLRGEPCEATPPSSPELFVAALAVGARRQAGELVDACLARFPGTRRVLDLGGGHGEYSLELARRGLEVTLQDLPVMVEVVARQGRLAAAGVRLFAGDFFEVLPEGPFDLVFCAGVTHTLDGAANLALYRRLRPLLAPGGGLAIVTLLRGHGPVAALFAVQMLANRPGGDTHGEEDYRGWLDQAGLWLREVADLPGRPHSLLCALASPPAP